MCCLRNGISLPCNIACVNHKFIAIVVEERKTWENIFLSKVFKSSKILNIEEKFIYDRRIKF